MTSAPWERQAGESVKAFAAFQAYRDLPARNRSVFAVAERLRYAVSERMRRRRDAPRYLRGWSRRWNWAARSAAWDAELDRQACEAQAQERVEMAERHAREAVAFQHKVVQRLQTLDATQLSPAQLIRWFEVAVKIERLSRGEPTEALRQEHVGQVNLAYETGITRRIVSDPEASELACRLLERIANCPELPGGSGVDEQPWPMEVGPAPLVTQPPAG